MGSEEKDLIFDADGAGYGIVVLHVGLNLAEL